jgi:putative restriction endonuclease
MSTAQSGVGDWVLYRKPRRGEGQPGYFGVARLRAIEPDPRDAGSSYARVDRYLTFDAVVPQQDSNGRPFEAILRAVAPISRGSAIQGRSIRPISSEDFAAITLAGLRATFDPSNAARLGLDEPHCDPETTALLSAPPELQQREIRTILLNRKIRDAAFRDAVCSAYDDTCAVTGLKIVNGHGRSEVCRRRRAGRRAKRYRSFRHHPLAVRSPPYLHLQRLPLARIPQQSAFRATEPLREPT